MREKRAQVGIQEMQALFEMTEGHNRLAKIVADFPIESPHWNEAQNRFHFIDRLLKECLGWEPPYIDVECTDDGGGRADYLLGRPEKAVLEAKRETVIFKDLPFGVPTRVRKLRPLVDACKEFESAVLQAISYCSLRGAQIAIVCNGPQLAVFQAIVVGQSPLDGECYFFNGFQTYLENFPLLWTILSPEGVAENRAYRDLALHRNPRIPPKASSMIPSPFRYRFRNAFQENLRSLASLLLEDVIDDPSVRSSFFKECYVPLEANNRHLLLSKNIIAARYKRVGDNAVTPMPLGSTNTFAKSSESEVDVDILAMAVSSRPFVVIGDVGVGKTSFFDNLFELLDDAAKDETFYLRIDLGIKATLAKDIKTHILDEIPRILKADYHIDISCAAFANAIYDSELLDFDKSVAGGLKAIDKVAYELERIKFLTQKIESRDKHIQAALGHLVHGRNKQIILVIDNADQRTFDIQQEAFLIAQELASSRNLLVFVAVRPSTFYQSKLTGALSGYQNRVLTIAPPPADEVLKRRILFAVRVAEGKIPTKALTGIKLQVKGIVTFLTATLRSIKENQSIQIFLSNITGGNTRAVIELVTSFCGSPNVDSEKIVEIEERDGDYKVPLHEFAKHALLGDYAYFNPQSSLVACNVFDVNSPDPRQHFLSCLIIAFLTAPNGIKDNDGFFRGVDILSEMSRHGFSEDQVSYELRRLSAKRLIETPYAQYREGKVNESVPAAELLYRATSIGIYHVRFWMGSFAFQDATAIDTPIFDPAVREQICKTASLLDIGERLNRATSFKQYLEAQWHLANINAPYFDFIALIQSQVESFNIVKKVVDRKGIQAKRR